jgi:hypothetical protein
MSGNPPNGIAADVVRVEDGRLAEHCDVIPAKPPGKSPTARR